VSTAWQATLGAMYSDALECDFVAEREGSLWAGCITAGLAAVDGCHRWAVADELGVESVPVMMEFEPELEGEPWPRVQMIL
jgi:hypothetical protein